MYLYQVKRDFESFKNPELQTRSLWRSGESKSRICVVIVVVVVVVVFEIGKSVIIETLCSVD